MVNSGKKSNSVIQKKSKPIELKSFKRHNYKIWWFVLPLISISLIFISVFRFTIFGVVIDDFLSLPFGICKYLLYTFFFIYNIIFLFGYHLRISIKGFFIILLWYFLFLWLFSNCILLYFILIKNEPLWSNNYYNFFIKEYMSFWYNGSIFSSLDPALLFYNFPINFWYLGGGICGYIIASPFLMLSFPVAFICSIIVFSIYNLWIFNFFKIFKNKKIKKENEKQKNETSIAPVEIKLTEEELKHQKMEENFRNYHHKLENSDIMIDPTIILDEIDEQKLDNEKNTVISNISRENNKSMTIIEELQDVQNYSSYSKEDFDISNSENNSEKFNNNDSFNVDDDEINLLDKNNNNNEQFNNNNEEEIMEFSNDDNIAEDNGFEFNDLNDKETDKYYLDEDKNDINDDDDNQSAYEIKNNIENDLIYYKDYNEYLLPNVSLLNNNNKFDENNTNKINWEYANILSDKIINVFKQFNVQASIQAINVGPQVTKFEILPNIGTKVKKIISLEYDLKLALATKSLRIEAPIQGKSLIGLEIPNRKISNISFVSSLKNIPNYLKQEKLLFGLGKTVDNKFMYLKLEDLPHLLISGTTGSGKSICLKGIISSIIMRATPKEVKLLLIDLKRVELKIFSKLPHLLSPIIYEHQKALKSLKILTKEMENRYNLFSKYNVNNIDVYNQITNYKLPKIIIIIDELADLMMKFKSEAEEYIIRLAQMARASGIYLIIATQRPSTDVITGIIKTNIPSRISFYLSSSIDSRTILDSSGAEKLISKGDMLYKGIDSNNLIRLQGIRIFDDEIIRIVQDWSKKYQPNFDNKFMINDFDYNFNKKILNKNKDPMYEEIKKFVLKTRKASVSLLQRYFSIGYIRACKIIDMLEAEKIIGPQNGSKPRDLLNSNNDNNSYEEEYK